MDADKVIIEPLLTEKTNQLREEHKYAFRVSPRANKLQVRAAVETLFNVHPINCNIMNVKGKPKRVRYRKGYTSSWKKAVVTLPASESIGIFEGA
ncbi:MAG: 50S ribosomal protein L23 [Spirochaetales bacterium]|nr:MAG: 50S ribosomal protein L23 [Spirochaetales bacterium]